MSTYTDINLNFKAHPGTLDVLTQVDVTAVKSALRTLLLSDKFFIPFNPDAGGGLQSLMFENLTPTLIPVIKAKIEEQIITYEPRVVLQDVVVTSTSDYGINIDIIFYVRNVLNQAAQTLNLVIERVR